MSIRDRILQMKPGAWNSSLEGDINKDDSAELQYLAAITAQTEVQGALALRRNLKRDYSASIAKSKQFSTPTEVFMVSDDGRVELTKMNVEGANILKSYGLTFVPADGLSMLTFKLAQKYGGEKVSLAQMLKCASFKEQYNKFK